MQRRPQPGPGRVAGAVGQQRLERRNDRMGDDGIDLARQGGVLSLAGQHMAQAGRVQVGDPADRPGPAQRGRAVEA